MKRTAWAIGASLGVALVLGCNILDTEPLGTLTDQTFYQTEKDFDAATLAPYSTMLNLTYDQNGMGWWDGFLLPDDNVQYRDPNRENDVFNWSATNVDFAWVWAKSTLVADQLNTSFSRFGSRYCTLSSGRRKPSHHPMPF